MKMSPFSGHQQAYSTSLEICLSNSLFCERICFAKLFSKWSNIRNQLLMHCKHLSYIAYLHAPDTLSLKRIYFPYIYTTAVTPLQWARLNSVLSLADLHTRPFLLLNFDTETIFRQTNQASTTLSKSRQKIATTIFRKSVEVLSTIRLQQMVRVFMERRRDSNGR